MNRSTTPSFRRTVVRALAGIGAVIVLGLTVGAGSSDSDSPTADRPSSATTNVPKQLPGGGSETNGIARW